MKKIHLLSRPSAAGLLALLLFAAPGQAHASALQGDTLDLVAEVVAWFALILAPVAAIVAFLAVHILPEKIAHKKGHPQTAAIQCLCLLSLVFGGLLWPLAWLWTYTKPVFYRMAYGTDKADDYHPPEKAPGAESEIDQLRARVAELESQLKGEKV